MKIYQMQVDACEEPSVNRFHDPQTQVSIPVFSWNELQNRALLQVHANMTIWF